MNLLEFVYEELPLDYGMELLNFDWKKFFEKQGINLKIDKITGTFRRFLIFFEYLQQEKEKKQMRGPSVDVAFKDDKPTIALLKFLEKQGKQIEDVYYVEDKKGKKYVAVDIFVEPKKIEDIKDQLIEFLLRKFNFRKKMRWLDSKFSFPRPLKSIAVYTKEKCKILYGKNYYLNPYKGFIDFPNNIDEWEKLMKENEIEYDYWEKEKKLRQIGDLAPYWAWNNEKIVIFNDELDDEYVTLPEEVVEEVLKETEKLEVKFNKGTYQFFGVTFIDNTENVKNGYKKVCVARLKDALFFYNEDLKVNFESYFEKLKDRIYHQKIGSFMDKVNENLKTFEKLANIFGLSQDLYRKLYEGLKRAKNDQETLMVQEFTELEGIMGYYYQKEQGVDEVIAKVSWHHYLPKTKEDRLPEADVWLTSLAEKLTNISLFAKLNMLPKANKDPFGIRRSAIAVVRLLREYNSLKKQNLIEILGENGFEFLQTRALILFKEDMDTDIAQAVLESSILYKESYKLGKFLNDLRKNDIELFRNYIYPLKRIYRILEGKEIKEVLYSPQDLNEYEKKIYELTNWLMDMTILEIYEKLDFVFRKIANNVNEFFDNVMVMSKDEKEKAIRLDLLNTLKNVVFSLADFSKIKE